MMDDTKRKELLHRWRGIEEEDENDDDDSPIASNKRRRFQQLKENWCFSFFLIQIDIYIFIFFHYLASTILFI